VRASVRPNITLACALALALAACSGTEGTADAGWVPPPPPPGDAGEDIRPDAGGGGEVDAGEPEPFTLGVSLGTPSTTVAQGTTAELFVELNYDRSRAAKVDLAASAPTGGLTAVADPAAADGRFVPTLRLQAAEGAAVGAQKVTLTASANGVTKTVDVTVNVTANTGVSGVVVDQNGQPMKGVQVRLGGRPALTEDNGSFYLANVTPPYDLDLVDGTGLRAYRFVGLTRRDPHLHLAGMRQAPQAWAAEGRLELGSGVTLTNDAALWVGMAAPRVRPKGKPSALDGNKFYNTPFRFHGPAGAAGMLWGLLGVVDGDGRIASIEAFGEVPASAVAGTQATGQVIPLRRVTNEAVTSSVTAPAGYAVLGTRAWLGVAEGSGLWLTRKPGVPDDDGDDAFDDHAPDREALDPLQGGSFLYSTVPPFARLTVSAVASEGTRKVTARLANLLPGRTAPALVLPRAPAITAPASAATVAGASDFTWTDDEAGRVYVAAWGSGVEGEPAVVVVTKDKRATLPDFAASGVLLPKGAPIKFRVLAVAPYDSVDGAAGSRGLRYDYLLPTKSGRGRDRDGSAALEEVTFQLQD
jgi:hypothetical protein